MDKNLFKQHPEFKQSAEVKADVIAPGKMLISVQNNTSSADNEDPIVSAFLAFIEKDMIENPSSISVPDKKQINRAKKVMKGVKFEDKDFE